MGLRLIPAVWAAIAACGPGLALAETLTLENCVSIALANHPVIKSRQAGYCAAVDQSQIARSYLGPEPRVAVPTNGPADVGYYVGGGAWTCWSSRQCPDQGTWSWGYRCRRLKPIVALGWWQRPHEQGGAGSYAPDGPRCCPE